MDTPSLSTRILTDRFLLRPPREDDVRAISASLRRNAEHLAPRSPEGMTSPAARSAIRVSADVARMRSEWRKDLRYTVFAFRKGDERTVLGRLSLQVQRGVFQNAYLGYWCDVEEQGKGLTTEGVRAMVAFAFGPLRLHRVQAAVMPDNPGSLRVLEKAGFRREGLAERYLQIAGVWADHVLFATTIEEWTSNG